MRKRNDTDPCPCQKDCPDRWVSTDGSKPLTCHCVCPHYTAWVERQNARKEAAAVKKERWCATNAQQKAYWRNCKKDRSGAYKKFSQ